MNADASSWAHRPFEDGVPFKCSLSFSCEEFERIRAGLIPQTLMDDKWFIYYESPFLYFHRSSTGQPVYRLKLATREQGVLVEEALLSTEIAKISEESEAYESLFVDALVSSLLLGNEKPFPVPWDMRKPLWKRWLVAIRRWSREFHDRVAKIATKPSEHEPTEPLAHETHLLDAVTAGRIIEILFRGAHHWSHGHQMSRVINDVLRSYSPVAGVVVNLLEYEYEYEFGNDVGVLFVEPVALQTGKSLRPTCIVAIGKTHDAMHSLYAAAGLRDLPLSFASNLDEGLVWIRSELQE